jgi:ubiquinone/menaquinone biosynthesis C-methylase UbiE
MPPVPIDALTSPTLKYLRERWWDEGFTAFLADTLRPRAGNRILDVGCGEGVAEIEIGRLHVSQLRLVGVDLMIERVMVARHETAAHNQRVGFATGDACDLPFGDGVFDAAFCVAVLQHIGDVERAVRELARVTREGRRILAVEPDNSARYWYSSVPSGRRAFETAGRFFAAVGRSRGEKSDTAVGPRLATLFARSGVEPIAVKLFPVSNITLGTSDDDLWTRRRAAVERTIAEVSASEAQALGREYLDVLAEYGREALEAGAAFAEIQHTTLFATVGQKAG